MGMRPQFLNSRWAFGDIKLKVCFEAFDLELRKVMEECKDRRLHFSLQ